MKLPSALQIGGSSGIATHLRQIILSGEYAHNDRLPSERSLAEHYGTSRGTIRAALRRLQEWNMVYRQVGSGTFVIYDSSLGEKTISDITSPLELIDVRMGIETQIVRLAVANATLVDIDHLEQSLNQVENINNESSAFSKADMAFHLALANCSRNRLMVWLYKLINEIRGHAQWSAMKDKILTPDRIKEYNAHHRELFYSISSRNLTRSIETIKEHLERARKDLVGAENSPNK